MPLNSIRSAAILLLFGVTSSDCASSQEVLRAAVAPACSSFCDCMKGKIPATLTCLETPSISDAGVYGTKRYPNANELAVSVFDGKPPVSLKIEKVDTVLVNYSYTKTVDISGSIGLQKIASWFPQINLDSKYGSNIEVTYKFENAELKNVRNLGKALRDVYSQEKDAVSGNPQNQMVQRSLEEIRNTAKLFCDPAGDVYVATNALLTKPTVTLRYKSGGGGNLAVGWQSKLGVNFHAESNSVNEVTIETRSPVIVAIELAKTSDLLNNSADTTCKTIAAADVRDSATMLAKGLLDNYECAFLDVGASVLNSVCPINRPPGTPAQPCNVCEIGAVNIPFCPIESATLYESRIGDISDDVVAPVCATVNAVINRSTADGHPISIDCDPNDVNRETDLSDWWHAHAATAWDTIIGPNTNDSSVQISLIRELIWRKRTESERPRVGERIQDMLRQFTTDLDRGRDLWSEAHSRWQGTLWPTFGGDSFDEFRTVVLARWFDYFSDPRQRGYSPGCVNRNISASGSYQRPGKWMVGDGHCHGGMCLEWAHQPSNTLRTAREFADALM